MKQEKNIFQHIYDVVARIPAGRVASYGQVAAAAGLPPSAARVVGWALKALPARTTVPWQRVVNREGVLSIVNPHVDALQQFNLLLKEGVLVEDREGRLTVDASFFHRF